ncbi:rhodanese-like domain protein [Plesiocystis pacifica SIR-1]|uniref:Rhodanese-like domain protein n=1 Tax=Plesiocystis pacifica SIR-1 TaxID=391625 RepID=A6GB52_9BACT|nr:rhodanese-like domain-containing protein [Plesiocystis pacifica]EDM76934.1 rhodanese-like domain protein [Plesiocystis pacifica SIR-1]
MGLLLLIGLAGVSAVLAHHFDLLRDAAWLVGVSLVGALALLTAHPDLTILAEPRADEVCGAEGEEGAAEDPNLERIGIDEAKALLGKPGVTFIDARATSLYEYAHIPGAVNLPAPDAEVLLEIQSLPIAPDAQVITYCDGGSCEQSNFLGAVLESRDLCRSVRVLDGGWQAWTAADGETVQGPTRFGSGMSSSEVSP